MGFKDWLISEAGHLLLDKPLNITVLYDKKPVLFKGVSMIDPRFEFMNIPMPKFELEDPRNKFTNGPNFIGQFTFSLPLVNSKKEISQWLIVPRINGMQFGHPTKRAYLSPQPEGIKAPLDWADYADIMDDGGKIPVTYGGNVAI